MFNTFLNRCKCPNGHIYATGECGGAMQTNICPECGTEIDDQSHQLTPSIASATEMDDSTDDSQY